MHKGHGEEGREGSERPRRGADGRDVDGEGLGEGVVILDNHEVVVIRVAGPRALPTACPHPTMQAFPVRLIEQRGVASNTLFAALRHCLSPSLSLPPSPFYRRSIHARRTKAWLPVMTTGCAPNGSTTIASTPTGTPAPLPPRDGCCCCCAPLEGHVPALPVSLAPVRVDTTPGSLPVAGAVEESARRGGDAGTDEADSADGTASEGSRAAAGGAGDGGGWGKAAGEEARADGAGGGGGGGRKGGQAMRRSS